MEREQEFWTSLRRLTAARIGLKRAGASVATGPLLDFQLAHARARDAVYEALDAPKLAAELAGLGLPVVSIASAADDRQTYLMRPDLGRRMAANADIALAGHKGHYDVVFVIADGLSARAVALHARPVLSKVIAVLRAESWQIAPLVIVRHGRVAIGDGIATALGAASVAVLDRRASGTVGLRQHGCLPDLRATGTNDRRRAQLHLQYPAARCRL